MAPALLQGLPAALGAVEAIFADCNLPAETLGWLAGQRLDSTRLAVNGVSPAKAARLRPYLGACDLLFVNRQEAAALLEGEAAGDAPEALVAALRRAGVAEVVMTLGAAGICVANEKETIVLRAEEHTSELQSLMRNSYAVFCLKK